MKQEKEKRTRGVSVHLTPMELDHLDTGWRKSTNRKRSEYIRKLLLGKPVGFWHRNQSLDELMATLIPLRGELNFISQIYNQIVTKLPLLNSPGQIDLWLLEHEAAREAVALKITEIKSIISHIDDLWLQ